MHQLYGIKPVVFWLLGDLAKYDKSIDWQVPEFQALIQSFAKDFKVGIHPSYRSNQSMSILKMEVERLVNILNFEERFDDNDSQLDDKTHDKRATVKVAPTNTEGGHFSANNDTDNDVGVTFTVALDGAGGTVGQFNSRQQRILPFPSRQHFLKLRFPETYRRLLAVGIHEDWTMGYADQTGFRASIATPFPWFDLEKNEETTLIIHPFQAMDVTLNNYLKLTPEAALERLKTLIDTTKSVGGTFTTLWHNDNLAEMNSWKGWRVVYEKLLLAATYP